MSKTAAGCNDDLNSLSGNCPTYLARKLRPATKSVSMIPFNQNVSTFMKWELKEGPRAHWSRQSKMCHEHMTVHTQALLCSGVIAITTHSDCTLLLCILHKPCCKPWAAPAACVLRGWHRAEGWRPRTLWGGMDN